MKAKPTKQAGKKADCDGDEGHKRCMTTKGAHPAMSKMPLPRGKGQYMGR